MKNAFVIVTLSGLLAACATAPPPAAPVPEAVLEPLPPASEVVAAGQAQDDAPDEEAGAEQEAQAEQDDQTKRE